MGDGVSQAPQPTAAARRRCLPPPLRLTCTPGACLTPCFCPLPECRAWQKPWDFAGFSKTQKQNRAKQLKQEHGVIDALRQAAAAEPGAAAAAAARPVQ